MNDIHHMLNTLHYLSSILYSTFVTNKHKRLQFKSAGSGRRNSQNEALTCLAHVLTRTLVECLPTARTNHLSLCAEISFTLLTLLTCRMEILENLLSEREREREIEKFITRQPPIGEKDNYDSENSWISDGLPSSSRRRRRGDGTWEVGEWRQICNIDICIYTYSFNRVTWHQS